jgi:hypothetical protein
MKRFKISGNYFLCDGAGSAANGINVGAQDDVDIVGNTFQNIKGGIQVNAAATANETAYNVVLQSNRINVSGPGIFCPARNVSRLVVVGNSVVAGEEAFRCNGARVSNLVCTGNHLETTSSRGSAVDFRDIQTGKFAYNTLIATYNGVTIGGVASTNLRLIHNDVTGQCGSRRPDFG